jgi:hypothetical protein
MKCEDCKKEKATITFSDEPESALIRGYGSLEICRRCYIKRIEKGLKKVQENLIKQKELLSKEDALKQDGELE